MQELKATRRTELGKKAAALRRTGFLPAVLYGEGTSSQPISISHREFEKVSREAGESSLLTLDVEGKPYTVLIHDIAYDPLKGNPIHADFYAVRMDKAIRTKVPIAFFGESPAVKNESGILVKVVYELEVESLPQDLPKELRADLSSLQTLESRLSVRDILLPKGVRVIAPPDEIIALVETPRAEEVAAEVATAEAPVEVKTEREVKMEMKQKKEGEESLPKPASKPAAKEG